MATKARLDDCPICKSLAWWRIGDRVALILGPSGKVCGVTCDSCGGWCDDLELVGEDQVVLDTLGYRVRAHHGQFPREGAVRSASAADAGNHQHSHLPSARGCP